LDRANALKQVVANRRSIALGLAALAAAPNAFAQASAAFTDPRPRAYQLLGQPAPDFSFPKRGGGMAARGDYAGRTLILYFGGLWCPDCIVDGAHANALAARAGAAPGIDFLHIHTRDRFGSWGSIDRYFAETGYDYPVAFDASRSWARETYAIEWNPTYLIIDRAGIIRAWRTDLGEGGSQTFFAVAQAISAD
jgi:peroxiredoxin